MAVSREVDIITVPDSLGGGVGDVETLHALVDRLEPAEGFVLVIGRVGFVKPYGVVALLLAARRLVALCGRRVELANLGRQVHSYLERMDLFEVGGSWLAPTRGLDDGGTGTPQRPTFSSSWRSRVRKTW